MSELRQKKSLNRWILKTGMTHWNYSLIPLARPMEGIIFCSDTLLIAAYSICRTAYWIGCLLNKSNAYVILVFSCLSMMSSSFWVQFLTLGFVLRVLTLNWEPLPWPLGVITYPLQPKRNAPYEWIHLLSFGLVPNVKFNNQIAVI